MDFKHIEYVITYFLKSKAVQLYFIALAWSIKGDGRSGYVLVFAWVLLSFHLLGRRSSSMSRDRGLWEQIHTPCMWILWRKVLYLTLGSHSCSTAKALVFFELG